MVAQLGGIVRRGPAIMMLATLAFTAMIASVKHLRSELGAVEVVFFRAALSMPLAALHAVDAIVHHVRREPPGTVTLCPLGPLTNIATALQRAPDIAGRLAGVVLMGGAYFEVGNITPAAEYNIWCDPEAARLCFRSGLPIEMVGWELCRGTANLGDEDMARCHLLASPWATAV